MVLKILGKQESIVLDTYILRGVAWAWRFLVSEEGGSSTSTLEAGVVAIHKHLGG